MRQEALRALLEDIAVKRDGQPVTLAQFVDAVLRTGYRQRGRKSVSEAVHALLRRMIDEGTVEFDDSTRQYYFAINQRQAI